MGLCVSVPTDIKRLQRDIASLRWQIENEPNQKSKKIFAETLELYEMQLRKLQGRA